MVHDTPVVPWWRVQYGEEDALSAANAIRAEHLSLGPLTAEFEKQLAEKLGVPYIVATTSGSMALLMSLLAIGVGPGDEVIVPNRTWIAAAHAVMMLGAKAVFVDVLAHVPNIDTTQIAAKITARTKALIPTALNGRAVDMHAIMELARKHNLYVIEDAAQAFLSRNGDDFIGTQGDLGCVSLSVAKLLPTGQGGFVITKDQRLYQELRKIRTHGVFDLMECQFARFGFNCRYTDLQAAIGLTQLKKAPQKIAALNEIYRCYESGLKPVRAVQLIPVAIERGEVPLYIEVVCEDRAELIAFLQAQHIQAKAFYPNLNRAAYFNCQDNFVNANLFERCGVTLPCGPDQPLANVERVVQAISAYSKSLVNF
jgi:perosamine synthetase